MGWIPGAAHLLWPKCVYPPIPLCGIALARKRCPSKTEGRLTCDASISEEPARDCPIVCGEEASWAAPKRPRVCQGAGLKDNGVSAQGLAQVTPSPSNGTWACSRNRTIVQCSTDSFRRPPPLWIASHAGTPAHAFARAGAARIEILIRGLLSGANRRQADRHGRHRSCTLPMCWDGTFGRNHQRLRGSC